jgi:GNAT superfamily N-acetyltransferase
MADLPALDPLITASARELSRDDYTPEQVEGALLGAFGTDTQLIRDGSYFVAEVDGRLAGCGGWSRHRKLFGGDRRVNRGSAELDPARDAARIRAFFVHPDFARRGIGTRILQRSEQDAMAHGFTRFELMATLPGARLYAARGYQAAENIEWPLGDGLAIQFIPMSKTAAPSPFQIAYATLDDAEDILALQKLAYESEARLYDDWTLPPLTQTLPSLLDEFAISVFLKATEGDRLVGSVRAREVDGLCLIGRLIVHPELQGRSIGTLLMHRLEAAFPRAQAFELFTGSRSEGNLRLYERLGYRRNREEMLSEGISLAYLEKRR